MLHLHEAFVTQPLVDLRHRHRGNSKLGGELADRLQFAAVGNAAERQRVAQKPVELRADRHGEGLVDAVGVDREHVF